MFEPTREQMDTVDRLARKCESVAVNPPQADGAPITVQLIYAAEEMGFTTRAKRTFDLTINPNGGIPLGLRA